MKKIFTTGEVARLLGININTVIKWFDEGRLEGFRLPGSNERRIAIAGLRRFMSKNQIPLDMLGEDDSPMQRKFRRVPCQEPAQLNVQNGALYGPYESIVRDLSQGGARLDVQGEQGLLLPFGHFNLSISIIDGPLVGAKWTGSIVHLLPGVKNLAIGMRFATLSAEEENRLMRFVDRM